MQRLGRIQPELIARLCRLALFLCIVPLTSIESALACDSQSPCMIDGGSYLVRVPKGWDGKTPLPAVVFFHGYSSSAEEIMANEDLATTLSDANVLLIAPEGQADNRGPKSWSFPGKMIDHGRDDFAFVHRVVEDAEQRWPIDKRQLLASGFSVGGSMTWYIACRMPQQFAGFAPISGAFWVPEPEHCDSGPVNIRHIHGTDDGTVPMKGRILRNGTLRQGDVLHGLSTWRRINGCGEEPTRQFSLGELACRTWSADSCSSRKTVEACLHAGGHEYKAAWVLDGVHWLASLSQSSAVKTTSEPRVASPAALR